MTRDPAAPAPRSFVVSVGDELLLGETVNTNAAWLGRRLAQLGIPVLARTTVGDEFREIGDAIEHALEVAELIVVTGGLGPTPDDRTKEAVAELLDRPLETREDLLADLERRFREAGYDELPPANRSQAEVPAGAECIPNPHGSAPGLVLAVDDRRVVLLPGVPREMKGIFERGMADLLRRTFGERRRPTVHRTIHTTGIAESVLTSRVQEALPADTGPVQVAFLPRVTGVGIRLTAREVDDPEAANRWLDRIERELEPVVAGYRYASPRGDLVDALAHALEASGRMLATAESCTGGLLAQRLTARSGSSVYFAGGVVSYANESKIRDLGVPPDLLEEHGAVSGEVAEAMVRGVVARFDAEAGISITGIAGPTGGTEEKPVGTVWYAVSVDGVTEVRCTRFPGDRRDVRERSAQAALHLLFRSLDREREGTSAVRPSEEP